MNEETGAYEMSGQGGQLPIQVLADQLTLSQKGEGRICPPITIGTPRFFDLPASLWL
jgi:hypothetical protein